MGLCGRQRNSQRQGILGASARLPIVARTASGLNKAKVLIEATGGGVAGSNLEENVAYPRSLHRLHEGGDEAPADAAALQVAPHAQAQDLPLVRRNLTEQEPHRFGRVAGIGDEGSRRRVGQKHANAVGGPTLLEQRCVQVRDISRVRGRGLLENDVAGRLVYDFAHNLVPSGCGFTSGARRYSGATRSTGASDGAAIAKARA